MKRINSKNLMKLSLAIGALWWLTGCGSSKSSGGGFDAASTDQSSTVGPSDALANCSTDVANLADFQVQVMQYGSGLTPSRPDLLRVKIIKIPQDYVDQNWKVVMYRWTVAASGNTSIDQTALSYQFERKNSYSSFQQIISGTANNTYRAFYGEQIQGMVDYANQFNSYAPLSGATPADFFQGATFLVNIKDVYNAYQVLRISLKSNDSVMREVDVLIPTFQADPALYNADSRHPAVLQQLHPQKSKLGGNWTKDQYAEFARASCF